MKMRMIVTFLLVAAICSAAAGAFKFKPDPKDTSLDDTTGGDDTTRTDDIYYDEAY